MRTGLASADYYAPCGAYASIRRGVSGGEGDEAPDAIAEEVRAGGQGDAHAAPPAGAEGLAGRNGHVGFLNQAAGVGVGVSDLTGQVDEKVECPFRPIAAESGIREQLAG